MAYSILDCTLRDGGYYNNWDFEPDVVNAYLQAMADAKINYVELGFRAFPKEGFLGAFAYTTEAYINALELPQGPIYGVMIDAKTVLSSPFSVEQALEKLCVPASESKIKLVRVAAHFHEVEASGPIVKKLKSMEYIVGYNLMQSGGKPDDVIADKVKQIAQWGCVDVLYFADSLGNMDETEVQRIVGVIDCHWDGDIGIHTHNNMSQGLTNTLAAKDAGVKWLDTTVTGMGRGAGNTPTENFLAVLDKTDSPYYAKPVYELVIRHFEPMQKHYGWGSNLLYFLGAQNDVHPTYIQNLLSNTHYGTDEIVGAIDYLTQLESATSYNGAVLKSALCFSSSANKVSGSRDIIGLFNDKHVLVIGNGPSTRKYASAIEAYIKKQQPVVISINIVDSIAQELVDYYAISHNSKFLSEALKYEQVRKNIILPKHRFSDNEIKLLQDAHILDYGVSVEKNKFESHHEFATIPYDVTAAYVLALLNESNAASIHAVGFDGYATDDPRQQEMVDIFNIYHANEDHVNIISLTPTAYSISESSIYAPII